MIVTEVMEVTKAKARIFLDEEFAFVLYKGELRFYQIKKGQELSQEAYNEIMNTLLPKRAKKRCLFLLQKKDYTEEELRRKLRENEYPKSCIDIALDYVKGYHYVDDERYCSSYISVYGSKWSRQKIMTKLLSKGVDKSCIQNALEDYASMGELTSEEELIRQALEKKRYNAASADSKTRDKMYRHLLYKGFSSASIGRVLDEFMQEESNGAQQYF